MYLLLGIYARDDKGEVLEVGDKLLMYSTYSMQRGTSPHGSQLCSQPEVSETECLGVGATVAAAWTPPVGVKWEVHRAHRWGLL